MYTYIRPLFQSFINVYRYIVYSQMFTCTLSTHNHCENHVNCLEKDHINTGFSQYF